MRYRPGSHSSLRLIAARLCVLLCVSACSLFLVQTTACGQAAAQPQRLTEAAARRPLISCPSVSICCPASAPIGNTVVFNVSSTSGGTPGFRRAFHWTTSGGRITGGQGTNSIQVDTRGVGPGVLGATFEAIGYGLKCTTTCWTRLHPPYPSTLSGKVNTLMNGQPVRGARISVSASDRTSMLNTDTRGYFELAGLSPGRYTLSVTADDFSPQEQTVELTSAARRDVNFFLKSLPPPPPSPRPAPQASPSLGPSPSPSPLPSPSPEPTVAPPSKVSASPALVKAREEEQRNYLPYVIFILFCILAALGSAALLRDKTPVLVGDKGRELPDGKKTYEPPVIVVNDPPVGGSGGGGADVRPTADPTLLDEALSDEVTCSVFAPTEAPPGDCFLVQVFAHLPEQADQLEEKAKESDEDAQQRGSKKLATSIERGQELAFLLNMPGLEVDEPSQSLVWGGEVDSVQFAVTVPETCKTGNLIGTVTVCYQTVPIGHIKFKFKIASAPAQAVPTPVVSTPLPAPQQHQVMETASCAPPAVPPEQSFVRYKQAFISYASEDRPEVLKRVQMLKMARIKFFQDLLTLEPGDNWEQMIYKYLDESDVVYLFWSNAARRSTWVEKEIQYALKRKGGHDEAAPEILPVIIEGPPIVPPSDDLKSLHFNDTFMYLIRTEESVREQAGDPPVGG